MPPRQQLQFEEFLLDPSDERLWREGHHVPLTPKAFAVLLHLVTHAGRLVTKEDLFEVVWPGVFVGDAALKVAIREVRRALGDDPRTPRFIETAHRRGYRFIARVERHVAEGAEDGARPASEGRRESTTTPPPVVAAEAGAFVAGRARQVVAPGGVPPTRYARSGDVNIAYQVVGDGPFDLVFVMGWISHLDYFWTEPSFARFLRRLGSFSRLILFDKRGTGLSDRVTEMPTLETRMADVRAVMDAMGSKEAALLGVSEGGPMCSLFAATYPEKTRALVMVGTYARRIYTPDYPWAPTREEREQFCQRILDEWGGPVGLEERAPSVASDPEFRAWWATYLRMGASPGAAVTLTRMNCRDRRPQRAVERPRADPRHPSPRRSPAAGRRRTLRRVADPGARFIELPGFDHLPFVGDQDAVLDAIEQFLTAEWRKRSADRVLATVLSMRLGDAHDASETDAARRADFEEQAHAQIEWFHGHGVAKTPEGLVAAFDGPARAIRCGAALATLARDHAIDARLGLHTGECDVLGDAVAGLAVEIAHSLSNVASPGEVLVSRTVRDLVAGSGLWFDDRGSHAIESVGSEWRLFRLR